MTPNQKAFLDMTAWSEGTSTNPLTANDGYDVIVTGVNGPEVFTDYSDHPFNKGRPSKKVNNSGLYSSASGRYQIMKQFWPHYKALLHLPDFSPHSQDLYALQQVRERKALDLLEAGKIEEVIKRCSNIWASFTGAGYGQHEHKMEDLVAKYKQFGGQVAS